MNKAKDIRKKKIAARDSLSAVYIKEKSKDIQTRVLALRQLETAENIFIYVSFRSEVQTLNLIGELLKIRKKISVPITHVQQKRMDAVYIENLKEDLIPGYCGILEPTPLKLKQSISSPDEIDIVIVPGSVFDERGGRFGYGGGYYDRFLEKIPGALRIGLAFELQIIEKAPLQKHDQLLDMVITEKRVIKNIR